MKYGCRYVDMTEELTCMSWPPWVSVHDFPSFAGEGLLQIRRRHKQFDVSLIDDDVDEPDNP